MATASDTNYKAPRLQLSLADFELLRRIGDGSYSHVVLARHKATGKEYALKVIDKQYILRHRVVDYIRRERQILDSLQDEEGIARLHFTFQDAYSLYLGLEHCPNGELYDQIRLRGKLPEGDAARYAAEVVAMLGVMRRRAVVHRDLKPENLLLDGEGHLKLIDFGSAKQLAPEEAVPQPQPAAPAAAADVAAEAPSGGGEAAGDAAQPASEGSHGASDGDGEQGGEDSVEGQQGGAEGQSGSAEGQQGEGGGIRAVSLVGTADYVSPEVLNNRRVSCAADLWALGCVLFQMLTGKPPFKSPSEYLTFQKIVEARYELPEHVSPVAADLVGRLLKLEPSERIGASDLAELRAHPFFAGIQWDTLRSQPAPEFVPDLDPALSSASSSFDWELQSLASALPLAPSTGDHLELE